MIQMFHSFLLGLVATAVIHGAYWLATGEVASFSTAMTGSLGLYLTTRLLLEARRVRETQRLQELYERPSFGE